MSANAQVSGSYAYDKAIPLIDYCGDSLQGKKVHSTTFSSNNIKRLIISPDAVCVYYHIPIASGDKYNISRLDCNKYFKSVQMPDYKPILSVITSLYICSSIEEIIFIIPSKNQNVSLSGVELDYQSMLSRYVGKQGSFEDSLKARFCRLCYISFVNIPFDYFMTQLKSSGYRGNFLSESPICSSSDVRVVNDPKTWYERNGISVSSRSSYPEMDGLGGRLDAYFKRIAEENRKITKAEEVKKFTDEANKELLVKLKKEYQKYKGILSVMKIVKSTAQQGYNTLYRGSKAIMYDNFSLSAKLKKCSYLKEKFADSCFEDSSSEREAILYNTSLLMRESTKLYCSLLKDFLLSMVSLSKESPLTVKFLMMESDRSLYIPDGEYKDLNDELYSELGLKYEGVRFDDAVSNLATNYVKFFISDCGAKSVGKLENKNYWMGVLHNARD